MQVGTIQPGQNAIVIDDLVATGEKRVCASKETPFSRRCPGGSAVAAGELVAKQGGKTVEYLFIIEATSLNARSKLDGPLYSIIQADG
jgi:adenine phosphoribosyltransferase